jgi:hypothetical protein
LGGVGSAKNALTLPAGRLAALCGRGNGRVVAAGGFDHLLPDLLLKLLGLLTEIVESVEDGLEFLRG